MQDLSAGGDDGPTQDDETILTEIKKKAEQSNYTAVITIAPEERSVNYILCNHDCAYYFIFLAFVRHNLCDYFWKGAGSQMDYSHISPSKRRSRPISYCEHAH